MVWTHASKSWTRYSGRTIPGFTHKFGESPMSEYLQVPDVVLYQHLGRVAAKSLILSCFLRASELGRMRPGLGRIRFFTVLVFRSLICAFILSCSIMGLGFVVISRSPGKVHDNFQNISLHVVSMFLWVQDLLPGLAKLRQANSGNYFGPRVRAADIPASSALPLSLVIASPLGSTMLILLLFGWYTPAPMTESPFWTLQLPSV